LPSDTSTGEGVGEGVGGGDGDALEPDAVAGGLVLGPAARLAEAGVALAAPWPALHAVVRKTATVTTAAIGDADHLNERFMFILRVSESKLSSR
jgi:hypothetical protein